VLSVRQDLEPLTPAQCDYVLPNRLSRS